MKHNNSKCDHSYPLVLTSNDQHCLSKQKHRSDKSTVKKVSSKLNNYMKRKMDAAGNIEAKNPNLDDLCGKGCTRPKDVMASCNQHCLASILQVTATDTYTNETAPDTCPDLTKMPQIKLLDKKKERIHIGQNSALTNRLQSQSREAENIKRPVETCHLMNPVKEHEGLTQVRERLTETIAIINAVQSNLIQSNKQYLPPIHKKEKTSTENNIRYANHYCSCEWLCGTEELNMKDVNSCHNTSEQNVNSNVVNLQENNGDQSTETSVERKYKQVRTNLFLTDSEKEPSKKENYVKSDGSQSETSTSILGEINHIGSTVRYESSEKDGFDSDATLPPLLENKATQCEGASICKDWGRLHHISVQTLSIEPTSNQFAQTDEVKLISRNSQTVLKKTPVRLTSHVFVTVDISDGRTGGRPLAECRKNVIKSPIRIYHPSELATGVTDLTDILSNQPRELPNFNQEDDKFGSVSTPALFRFKSSSVPAVVSRSGMKEECMKAKSDLEIGQKANIFEIGSKPSRLPISLPPASDACCWLHISPSTFTLTNQGGDFVDNKLKTTLQEEQLAKMVPGTGSPALSRRGARKRKLSGGNISSDERSYTRNRPLGNRKKALRKQSKTSSHLETPRSLSKDGHSSSSVNDRVKNNYFLEKNRMRQYESTVNRGQTEKIQKSKSEPSSFWHIMNPQRKQHEENSRISKSEQDFPLGTGILGHQEHTQLLSQENKKGPHSTVSSSACDVHSYSHSVSKESLHTLNDSRSDDEFSKTSSSVAETYPDDFTHVDSTSCDNDRNIVMDSDTQRTASLNFKMNEDTISFNSSSTKISAAQTRSSSPDRDSTRQHQPLNSSLPDQDDSMKEITNVTGLKKIQQLKMPVKIDGAENAEIIIYYSKKGSTINDSTGHEKKDILLSETIGSFKDMLNWLFQSVFSSTSQEHPTQTVSAPKVFTPKTEPVHVYRFKATPATCNQHE